MELKNFQREAVNEILEQVDKIFKREKKGSIILKSPTGSGKTFTMSHVINEIATDIRFENEDVCFLWISIGKGNLEEQSYNSLTMSFNGYPYCYLLEEDFTGGKTSFNKNDVVVFNWEKIRSKDKETGEWKNKVMKDKETNNFIDIIKNTKDKDRKIILIIDESHSSAKTERANEIINEIDPYITIEMSATPVVTNHDYKYEVDPERVIEEELIKKEILINTVINTIDDNESDSETLILESAYKITCQKENMSLYNI